METESVIQTPSFEAVESSEKLNNAIHLRFPLAVSIFQQRWKAWHDAWSAGATSQSLDKCTQMKEFDALMRLGPKIIPLVVRELAQDPDKNSIGVLLYTALEGDAQYSIKPGQPLTSTKALQRYSTQIVELNYQRNKLVDELIEGFQQNARENSIMSSSCFYTDCDAYWDMLELGPSIIAQLMVAYFDNRGGFWFQLLHEIVHSRKLGAYMFQKPILFEQCRVFMDEGEYDQVPEYIPNDWDIYFRGGPAGPLVREFHKKYRR